MNDNYGVVSGIGEGIKIGLFFVKDICCLATVIVPAYLMMNNGFPPTEKSKSLLFFIVAIVFAFYLDLHPLTNPGKRNYEVIWMLLKDRKPKSYKSFGYYEFRPLEKLKEEWSHGNSNQ